MRYQVQIHYGRTALPCRNFTSYQSARRFARSLHRASIRLILTGREWAGIYAAGTLLLCLFAIRALGA